MKKIQTLIFVMFIISNGLAQGKIDGFYKEKNKGSIVLGLGFEDPKKYIAGNEKLDLSRSLYYANLYADYGLTDNLNIAAALPFLSSNKESNLQDVSIVLKYRAFSKILDAGTLQLSFATGFSTPVTNYQLGGLNDIGQQATILDVRAMAHYIFNSGWFATFQSGYSFKFEETPNSLPLTLKVGKATTNWYYDFYYDYQHSFGGIDYLGTPPPQNFKELGVDFHKVGGSIYKPISENFGSYIALSYLLGGRNTFVGPAYGLGLVYKY